MAEMADDPDSQYFEILKTGVPLGVKEPPLKSPGIWPTKEELKGESPLDGALEDPRGRGNYASAEIHSDDIRKTFLEERDMDMVLGPLTAQEAASLCGCDIPEPCPGPMAAIDEGDKIRTIYDGSWGGANAHIQANTEERTTAPTVMDCLHGIHWLQASQKEPGHKKLPYAHWDWPKQDDQWMLLKADVTKAHRRVKILPPEWRYQVAKLEDEWWINKVGTYGMASAQLYWGRLASVLLRLLYHVFPMVDWGFVFVDDFCWLLRKSLAGPLTSAILLFLVAFGCPLSWKKTAIGLSNTWLGFIMTPDLQLVRMAPTKHELVIAVLDKMMDNQTFTKQELDSALGRLQWATNCCPLTKPFLQISLRKTTIIQPLTPLRAPGGGQVMQVPQTVERHTLEVGSATSQTQQSIRYGGSITRSRQTSTLGPSRTASPSVALQLWKCWVHSFSRCTYVRRVRPSGDRCFYPWPVITRAMSTGC